jgi:hypothetical protein
VEQRYSHRKVTETSIAKEYFVLENKQSKKAQTVKTIGNVNNIYLKLLLINEIR